MVDHQIKSTENNYLKSLGLSAHALEAYAFLRKTNKPEAVNAIAVSMGVMPNAVYRICYELEILGLIHRINKRPIEFTAVSKLDSFPRALDRKHRIMESQLEEAIGKNPSGHQLETYTINGRQALYDTYIAHAKNAQHEIEVYAIGIAYTEELFVAQKAAISRNVRIRHLIQQLKKDNYHIIHKWQKLGVTVKLLKSARGFHLSIIDNKVALITFSNPLNTEDRLTIVTQTPAAVITMSGLFDEMWKEATDITI